MIHRHETWGTWVKLESPPAIVALDREGARAVGLDGGATWSGEEGRAGSTSAPLEVHLAVTQKCGAGCTGCYLDARPEGEHVGRARLEAELDALARAGVFTVAFGGGEPLLRDDLAELAEMARARGITPVLTTSGLGLTDARAQALRGFAQVNVSYDGVADDYARVRGFDGARAAERAIGMLAAAGVRVGVNVVLTQSTFEHLDATVARARACGAKEAQLLRYKPAGRAASLDYLAQRLSPEQARRVPSVLRALVRAHCHDGAFSVRIDCAMVPFFSADDELVARADDLARLGIFGCEAGEALLAVRADGRVAPCSFAAPTELEGIALDGRDGDATLTRWRSAKAQPDEPCASCALRSVCKGGCKVVSTFVDGVHGPDPECPRVRAHRASEAGGRGVERRERPPREAR